MKRISWLAGMAVTGVGGLVAIGWLLRLPALQTFFLNGIEMKFNTALALILSGAILRLRLRTANERQRWFVRISALLMIVIAALTLAEYLFGWNLGIDQWLVRDISASAETIFPGRMSPITAINLILLGTSFLLIAEWQAYRAGQILALTAGFIALLAFIGYLYDDVILYRPDSSTPIALNTTLALVASAIGILFVEPEQGIIAILTRNSAGGMIARRLLPATIALPILLGWLRVMGQQLGWYDNTLGVPLFALSNVIVFTVLTASVANSLHHADIERRQALANLRQANEELELRVAERTAEFVEVSGAVWASQQRLESILDNTHDAIIAVDEREKIVLFNQAAEKIFGYKQDEILDQPLNLLIPSHFHRAHGENLQAFGQSKNISRLMAADRSDIRGLRKNGQEFIAEVSISKLELQGKRIFTAVLRDVTESRQAVIALRESEERFRQMAENINQGFWIRDPIGERTLYVSPALETISGLSLQSFYEDPLAFMKPFHPDDFEQTRARIEASVETGFDLEFRILRPDGEVRWLRARGWPVRSAQGQVYREVGVVEDITERKLLEAREVELKIQREKTTLLNRFIGDVSHDLRTPLTIMKTSLYLLRRKDREPDVIRHLDKLDAQANHMQTLIEDVFALSELEASDSRFHSARADLNHLAYDVCEALRPTAARQQHDFSFQPEKSLPEIWLEIRAFADALRRLILNAISYTPAGGVITVKTAAQDKWATVEVSDNGIGISAHDLALIFEPFYRVDKARDINTGGSGLGLAIVKRVVERHNGQIEVESAPGEGSTFRLLLPIRPTGS